MTDYLHSQEAEAIGTAVLKHIKHLSEEIGPRPVGSPAEQEAAKYVQERLRTLGRVRVEWQDFRTPRSAWIPFAIASGTALLGLILWFLLRGSALGTYLGALGVGFALWEIYAHLNFGWTPLTALAPNTDSQNVIATVPPESSPGRDVVVFAHLDTQHTPFFSRNKTWLVIFGIFFYVAIAVLSVTLVVFVVSWFSEIQLPLWVGIPGALFSIVALLSMLQAELSAFTKGANDNASAVGIALALVEQLAEHPLQNTRLWFVFTGAEESKCTGADRFLETHGSKLVQGYALVLESLGICKPKYSTGEGMLRKYQSNSELLRIAEKVGRNRPELGLAPTRLKGGFSEAGLASKRGYRSITIIGVDDDGYLPYWHSPEDDYTHIKQEPLVAAYVAAESMLRELDRMPTSISLSRIQPLSERS